MGAKNTGCWAMPTRRCTCPRKVAATRCGWLHPGVGWCLDPGCRPASLLSRPAAPSLFYFHPNPLFQTFHAMLYNALQLAHVLSIIVWIGGKIGRASCRERV